MRLTEKSQVTIPKPIRDRLGIGPGSEVDFIEHQGQIHLVKLAEGDRKRLEVENWLSSIRGTGTGAMTTDEIMDATRGPFDDVDPC